MNDKALDCLKMYDCHVNKVSKGRGGMLLSTDKGYRLLLECQKSENYYEKEDRITRVLFESGFDSVDQYIRNLDGMLFTEDESGRKYILKKWYNYPECDVKDEKHIKLAVRNLAKMHMTLLSQVNKLKDIENEELEEKRLEQIERIAQQEVLNKDREIENRDIYRLNQQKRLYERLVNLNNRDNNDGTTGVTVDIRDSYKKHTRELKAAFNYLKNKKNRSKFEQLAYKNINTFYAEASSVLESFNCEEFDIRFKKACEIKEIAHSSYNYHNILIQNTNIATTNFDKYKYECQLVDLYDFMRKLLEKYDWDERIANLVFEEYNRVTPLSEVDVRIIVTMLSYPEKFWKIINHYMNSNKAWIPQKDIDKLENVIVQNNKRKDMVKILYNK